MRMRRRRKEEDRGGRREKNRREKTWSDIGVDSLALLGLVAKKKEKKSGNA